MHDLSRFAIHTITTKPWPLDLSLKKFAGAGATGVSIWKESLEGFGAEKAARLVKESGLTVVSLVRGGFFVAKDAEARKRRIGENLALLETAAVLGAPQLVLVCGADPAVALPEARIQIREGIETMLPVAEKLGVKLAIEPLHPMYADCRSAVNTMKQATDLALELRSDAVGVAVDVYHVWWDPDLESEIARCGKAGKILAFHVCDWLTPTADFLNDRGLMGEGCIDIPGMRTWVEKAGFHGFVEVEIFSNRWWAADQDEFLAAITKAWKEKV